MTHEISRWIDLEDKRDLSDVLIEADASTSAASPWARRRFRLITANWLKDTVWDRWKAGKVSLCFVTVLLQRHMQARDDLEFDRPALKMPIANLFARDRVSYIGVLEFAPVNISVGSRGHERFDHFCPHAHLIVWGDPADVARTRRLAKRRGRKLAGGPADTKIVDVKLVKKAKKADLARMVCYALKTSNVGYVLRDGRWLGNKDELRQPGVLDQFRLLNRFELPELILTRGEGKGLRRQLTRP